MIEIKDARMLDQVIHGDALEVLKTIPDNFCHSIVCDPPAGIHFMNMAFDHNRGGRDQWIAWLSSIMTEAYRVLKPGAHGLVWSLPRTSHWTATALEDAGFEIRDSVYHLYSKHDKLQSFIASLSDTQRAEFETLMEDDPLRLQIFGSGFPKSLDVSKSIDRYFNAEREVIGRDPYYSPGRKRTFGDGNKYNTAKGGDEETAWLTAPATPEAAQWQGWHTALKPSCEVWWKIRKPLNNVPNDSTIAETTLLLEVLLWLLSPADFVEHCLTLNPLEKKEALDFVRWIVNVNQKILLNDPYELMGMFNSQEVGRIYLSIVLLWNNILAALYTPGNTYTTSTKTNLTTELKILNSWLSVIIPENIIRDVSSQSGLWLSVETAESPLNEKRLKWQHIPQLTAPVNVGMPIIKNVLSVLVKSAESLSLDIPTNIESFAQENATLSGETATDDTTPKLTDLFKANSSNIAVEVWWLIRKPLDGSVAHNVLTWGCGALNIDATRVEYQSNQDYLKTLHGTQAMRDNKRDQLNSDGWARPWNETSPRTNATNSVTPSGRWPAHLLMSHTLLCTPEQCDPGCPVAVMDAQSGVLKSGGRISKKGEAIKGNWRQWENRTDVHMRASDYELASSEGGASRYFQTFHPDAPFIYAPKASRKDRSANGTVNNTHSTVKSQALMRYLVRLITPPDGVVLDCFAGSGSTAVACIAEGKRYILIEKEEEYITIARARIAHAKGIFSERD